MQNLTSLKNIYYNRNKEDILCWYKDKAIKITKFLLHFIKRKRNYINFSLPQYNGIKSDSAYIKFVTFYALLYLEKEFRPYEVLDIFENKEKM